MTGCPVWSDQRTISMGDVGSSVTRWTTPPTSIRVSSSFSFARTAEHSMPISNISWSGNAAKHRTRRSEEHTSELQSRLHLVCRLLLEKKKKKKSDISIFRTLTKNVTLRRV